VDEILMARDKSLISVYVPQEVKERLEEWAGEEDRSVSYIVGRLITDALDIREQQKQPSTPQQKPSSGGKGRGKKGGEG
jgi:molybdopterin-guanine dinucleotide biosynthesis protein A